MYDRKLYLLIPFIFVTLVAFLTAVPVMASDQDLVEASARMEDLFHAQVEDLHIPNAVMVIVADGDVIFQTGYGSLDLEGKRAVDPATSLFRVGSVGKLFTWTAVMQLVEQGRLDLHADVNDYLDFQIPSRLLGSRQAPEPITLAHLMTHTAGFEAYYDAIFRLSPESLLPLDEYVRAYLPVRVFPPGEVAAYSNYSASLAVYIVQRVSGQRFADYVEQHIFAPLQMQRSTFRQPLPNELSADLARAYRFVDGGYLPAEFEYMQEPEGSLSSSAADMAKFMIANLQGGSFNEGRILQADTLRQMHSAQPKRHAELGGMALGFMEGTFNGQHVLFHAGSTSVYDSGLYLLPDAGLGIFITYSGASHLVHSALFQEFMDLLYPTTNSPDTTFTPGMLERSRRYAGEYHQNTRSFTTSESITSLLLGVVNVRVDEDGYLLVTHLGETDRFVELEAGVYRSLRQGRSQDYFGPFRTIVFDMDPFGRTLLVSDGPMTYSRAPWYGSSLFTIPSLLLILLLMLASLLVWGLGWLAGLLRRRNSSATALPLAARWVGAAFALLALIYLVGSLASSPTDPVYNLPLAAFGVLPAWVALLDILPWMLAFLGPLALIFTFLAWKRGFWRLPGRVHYTLFTSAALLLLWIFYYWNIY
jgi:CubicO group peptidase (beta-lactamase class C family)